MKATEWENREWEPRYADVQCLCEREWKKKTMSLIGRGSWIVRKMRQAVSACHAGGQSSSGRPRVHSAVWAPPTCNLEPPRCHRRRRGHDGSQLTSNRPQIICQATHCHIYLIKSQPQCLPCVLCVVWGSYQAVRSQGSQPQLVWARG